MTYSRLLPPFRVLLRLLSADTLKSPASWNGDLEEKKDKIPSNAGPHWARPEPLLLGSQDTLLSSRQPGTQTSRTEPRARLPADPGSPAPSWIRRPDSGCWARASQAYLPAAHPATVLPDGVALTHLPVYILPNEKQLCLWKRAILVQSLVFSP